MDHGPALPLSFQGRPGACQLDDVAEFGGMKNAVIRARIDAELKAKASEVLKVHGLVMSTVIRRFLQQVVECGELPFDAYEPSEQVTSGEQLWAMKRAAQARDRRLVESGEAPPEAMVMLRPARLKGAEIEWPGDSLLDE